MLNRSEFDLHGVDEDIILVDITDRAELEAVIVTESGYVGRFDLASGKHDRIGNLSFKPFTEERRHPIFSAGLQLRSFRDYLAIVQVYGRYGTIFDVGDELFSKELDRQNYHSDICRFPVAFIDRGGETLLIHATDWNRLDITRLKGDELLTDRVVSYETDENYFDYFHCGLSVSPDFKTLVSNGWHWHPYGQITSYSVDEFLKDFEMSHVDLCLTDSEDSEDAEFELGWDRPLCWINNSTLAIGYNRGVGGNGKRTEFPSEILIYDLESNGIFQRIELDQFGVDIGNEVNGNFFFDDKNEHFIYLSEKVGLLIADINGRVVASEPTLAGCNYNSFHRLFYWLNAVDKRIEICSIENG